MRLSGNTENLVLQKPICFQNISKLSPFSSFEQIFVQAFEAIPLGAVNYFIFRCRSMHGSMSQTAWGSCATVFTFTRIIWYAHLEGRKFQQRTNEDIHEAKKGKQSQNTSTESCILIASNIVRKHKVCEPLVLVLSSKHVQDISFKLTPARANQRDESTGTELLSPQRK